MSTKEQLQYAKVFIDFALVASPKNLSIDQNQTVRLLIDPELGMAKAPLRMERAPVGELPPASKGNGGNGSSAMVEDRDGVRLAPPALRSPQLVDEEEASG